MGGRELNELGVGIARTIFERGLSPLSTRSSRPSKSDEELSLSSKEQFNAIRAAALEKVMGRISKADPAFRERMESGAETEVDVERIEVNVWLETRKADIRIAKKIYQAIKSRNSEKAGRLMGLKVLLSQGPG